MTIYLVELEAYDPALPGVRTLRYSSGAGYTAGYVTVASSSGTVVEPTLNPLVTFTRSSTATRINSAGVMETVGTNVPRFDHDSETLQPLGLLVEESRTNLYRSTGNLLPTGGSWSASNTPGHIVTATSELAPNGTEYFAQITYVNGDWRQNTATFTAGGTYTGSLYCKRGNQAYCGFELHFTGGTTVIKAIRYNFDTELLSVSSGATGTVTKLRNGIVRITLTVTDDGDGTNGYMLIHTTLGGNVSVGGTALYWGAMFEAGSVPTSYVPATPIFSSRSSAATYFDSTGTLQSAAAGVARFGYFYTGSEWVMPGLMVEGASTNLMGWSAGAPFTTVLGAVSSPVMALDGTATAARLTSTVTGGTNTCYAEKQITVASDTTTRTFSVFVRKGTSPTTTLNLFYGNGGTFVQATGVIVWAVDGAITSHAGLEVPQAVGGGWYRAWLRLANNATGNTHCIGRIYVRGQGTSNISGEYSDVFGFQLEATSAPSSYIPTPATFTGRTSSGTYYNSAGVLTTAASGVARNTYINVGGLWVSGGLLLEPAATNLILNTGDLTAASWAKLGADTISANSSVSPAGAAEADRTIEAATSGAGHGVTAGPLSFTAATIYTASIFAKEAGAGSKRYLSMLFNTAAFGGNPAVIFDVGTGAATVISGGASAIIGYGSEDIGGGWRRLWATSTASATASTDMQFRITNSTTDRYANYLGDGVSGMILWGAMLETGASMTSYYPSGASAGVRAADSSTSATVSRAADTVTNPAATRAADSAIVTAGAWLNTSEGTAAVEASRPYVGATTWPWAFSLDDAGVGNRLGIFHDDYSSDRIIGLIRAGSVDYASFNGSTLAANTVTRAALAYKANDAAFSHAGAAVLTDTTVTLPAITRLQIGNGDNRWNGHIRRYRHWVSRLPDADVQSAGAGGVPAGAALDLDFLTYAAPTVSIANGTYTLLVGGDVSTETRTVTVSGGSHTILPSAGNSRVTSYAFYTEASGTPESTYFDARIQEPGNWSRSLYAPGTTAGESMVGAGEIVLANPDGGLDGLLDYGVGGRAVRVWTVADEATPFSAASRWATGTAEQVEVSWSRATIRLRDRLELLAKPLQTTLYAGTTTAGGQNTAEGQAEDLKGQVKPLLYGEAHNIPAVLANAFDLIYQVSDGAVQSIDAVYDAGVPLLFSADFTTITALRGASIQGGYYATAKNLGLFRIGSSPFGAVTCDATEGATSGDRTAAQIAKRMLTRMGFTASDWDAGSITALDTDNSSPVGVWIAEPTEALEAITTVLGTVGGWLLPTRMGTFEMGRMEAPAGTPVAVWTEAEMLDRGSGIERIASNDVGAGVPIWKVTVRYGRIYAVQTGEALAGCVATARRAELASEWRSVTATDAGVKTLHLNAGELTVDTLYADEADAQAEANRLLALYGTRRDRLMIPVDTDLAAAVDLGRTVTVKIQRWGYGAGRLMTVIGLTERAGAGVTDVEVWG